MNFERQKGQRESVQNARFSMYLVKNQQVKGVKNLMENEKQRYLEEKMIKDMHENERKNQILTQRNQMKAAVDMFRWSRSREVQDENRFKAMQERQLIYQYEQEARELERMEAELIARLHTTQAMERQAFNELEQVMISASMPKKDRI